MKRLTVLVWVAMAGALQATQQPLDLATVMALARVEADDVAIAEARLAASTAAVGRASAERWPRLSLSEILTRTDAPADAFGLTLMQETFSFADFVAGDPNDPSAVDDVLTRVELEMPLWTGGLLSARIAQAEAAAAASQHQLDRSRDTVALAAAAAWIDLAEAREGVVALERALETVEAHLATARAHVAAGTLVASEALRAEVEQARLADLLAEARGMVAVAQSQLAFRLGMAFEAAPILAPLAAAPTLPAEREIYLSGSTDRADLAAARSGLVARELEVEAAQAGRRPKVGLMLRHDRHDDELFGFDGDSTTVAVMASVDLFDGGRNRAAVAQARAEAVGMQAEVARAERGARLEAEVTWAQAAAALDRARTAELALAAAREGERIVSARYGQGILRTLDVLDATAARREAEARDVSARAAAWRSALALAVATNRPPESVLDRKTADAAAVADPLGGVR